jgi:hypothetical protein
MKRFAVTIVSTLIAAGLVSAATPAFAADPSSTATAKGVAQANTASRHTLDRPLPEMHFAGSSFSDVIDFLSDVTGANFSVDWKALDAAKVDKDTPITLKMNSAVPLKKALKMILSQAGGTGTLTWYIDDGVIQITTQEQEDKEMITRVYPIQDLLFTPTDYNDAPSLSLQNNNSNGGGGGGQGGGGGGQNSQQNQIFTNTTSTTSQQQLSTQKDRADEIIKLITDSVRPEIWQVNGGTATISFFRGSLIVTAPRSVHEALQSH